MESSISGRKEAETTGGVFSESEAEFLAESMLGRVATASRSGQPHVVPVAYRFDGTSIYFGGWNLQRSLKFRNLATNDKVAFVVDEIISVRPWRVRGVEVRGRARLERGNGENHIVRIVPSVVRSWGFKE